MRQLSICLLGPYQVTLDGEPITEFRSDKVRALLAYLAVEAGIPHRRDALAGLLWPDIPDSTARKNLRLSLHRLRDPLEDLKGDSNYFDITRETIEFKPAAATVDVATFTDLLATNRGHEHRHLTMCEACVERLEAAAELYRGDFLEGFFVDDSITFSEWVLVKREGLHRQALTALFQLAEYHRWHGQLEQAQRYAQRQLELEPWREEAHRQLMDILARSGECSAALAQYERCRAVVAEELNVEPDDETERLYKCIRMMRHRPPHNLPPRATPFVGREEELAGIAELLANPDCRLLTIVGPGGIGKTRLAIQATLATVDEQAHLFLLGHTFVPLSSVESAEFLVPAIANALDFSFHRATRPAQQLIDHLREKEMLLVLDSFEHLLAATDFLVELLERAPDIKLLVTSRERLNVHWEWLFPLRGLPYPQHGVTLGEGEGGEAYDAARLFQTCACRVDPGFDLRGESATAVADICRTVEGMPLGVELAAAWVDVLPVTEIAAEIAHNLGLSAASVRSLPARHRSLQAVFDHAWCQLSPDEQHVLAQCAVFRGGFTREAAAAVISEQSTVNSEQLSVNSQQSTINSDETDHCLLITDHYLPSLVDKSLLRFVPDGRYEMHELLRHYAADQLSACSKVQTEVRGRHSAYYMAFLQRRDRELFGMGAAEVLAEIKTEIANVRAAWHWAASCARIEHTADGLSGLSHFYLLAGPFQEGTELIEMAVNCFRNHAAQLEDQSDEHIVLGKLLAEQARLLNRQGEYKQAVAAAREATDLARSTAVADSEAVSRLQWGTALHHKGEYEVAQSQLEQAVALAQAAQTQACTQPPDQAIGLPKSSVERLCQVEADGLRNLGIVSMGQGQHNEARACYEQALHIYREIGDRRGESGALNNLGAVCYEHGDYAGATRYCEQALHIFREIGNRGDESTALGNLGLISVERGEYTRAESYFEQALHVCRELGNRQDEGVTLVNLGLLYHRLGEYGQARTNYEPALRIYREIGDRRSESLALSCLCLLFHHLGDDESACDYGRPAVQMARDVGDPNVLGYALTRLGHALVGVERLAEAAEVYREALALRQELGQANLAMESLAGLARVSMAQSDQAQAQAEVEAILSHLDAEHDPSTKPVPRPARGSGHGLDGTDEPFRVYLTCYRVLAANRDARAPAVLNLARNLLQEQAINIEDPKLQRSFLEDVAAHRRIMAEVKN